METMDNFDSSKPIKTTKEDLEFYYSELTTAGIELPDSDLEARQFIIKDTHIEDFKSVWEWITVNGKSECFHIGFKLMKKE
jgi:hypothetical protein